MIFGQGMRGEKFSTQYVLISLKNTILANIPNDEHKSNVVAKMTQCK